MLVTHICSQLVCHFVNAFKFIGIMFFQWQTICLNYFHIIYTLYYFHYLTIHVSTMQYCFVQCCSVDYFKVILPIMYLCIWWHTSNYIIFNVDAGLSFLVVIVLVDYIYVQHLTIVLIYNMWGYYNTCNTPMS